MAAMTSFAAKLTASVARYFPLSNSVPPLQKESKTKYDQDQEKSQHTNQRSEASSPVHVHGGMYRIKRKAAEIAMNRARENRMVG